MERMKIEIEKSEYDRLKSREEKLMAYYEWFVDKENDLVTVEDIVNKNTELEEENKKLNEFKNKREESMFYFKAQMERAEPKTAREAEDLQRAKEIFEKLYREELDYLEEENKKLKSDLHFERTMLDNVRAEYESSQNVIKELKEELISRIRQPQNVPYGKGVAELMEEDTLQELRDLGEI